LTEAIYRKSAGVVIIKKKKSDFLYLALVKDDGEYDIAKGKIEDGESDLECACREAKEEAGIILTNENFKWGFINKRYNSGIAFISTTTATPKILPNPSTGELEHKNVKWVTFDEMLDNVSSFLRPIILWSNDVISKSGN